MWNKGARQARAVALAPRRLQSQVKRQNNWKSASEFCILGAVTFFRWILLTIVLSGFTALPAAAAPVSTCETCHGALENPAYKEFHTEWKESIHARRGVSCEVCHGGNPQAGEKDKAHRGVYGSMDPKSTVYYTKIPALCGECHKREFGDFKMSKHYTFLMDQGIGPTCVTCHDSMSTKILKPADVEIFCAVCHNTKNHHLPEVVPAAREALEQMTRLKEKIAEAAEASADREKSGVDTRRATGFLNLAGRELASCREHWHTFEFAQMEARLKGVEALLESGLDALRDPIERSQ